MSKLSNIFYILLLCWFVNEYAAPAYTQSLKEELIPVLKKLEFDIPIRVLIENKDASDGALWNLESPSGFVIVQAQGKKAITRKPTLSLASKAQGLSINNKVVPVQHLFIIPWQGHIKYNGIEYPGIFSVTRIENVVYLVNHVELEDYVVSVLPSESWPGWPDEVNKAFCIGFRSYGIAKVLEQRRLYKKKKIALPYDIKNTRVHQVYKGRTQDDKLRQIAQETRGIVLAHKDQPILAMFDICCGGVIPAKKRGINFISAPYLARSYACTHCKNYKFYRWQAAYTLKELEALLKKELPALGTLRDLKVARKDGAGIVQEISIRGSKGWFSLPASKFKALFKELKSLCFSIQKRGSQISMSGKGFGHLVGLCQRGAYSMVNKGWNYKNILKFYYPHTTFMKLKKLSMGSIYAKL